MAINFEALRKKLQENQKSENKPKQDERPRIKFWYPKEGVNNIRILPGKTRGNDFYVETWVHWVENSPINCRKMDGHDDCPVCNLVKKLRDAGETGKASRMKAGKRYYFNIIDRDNEKDGPMVFGCGVSIFNQVLSIMIDPDYGDITDPENGFDLKLVKTSRGGGKVDYNLTPRRKESPLGVNGWEEKMYDLSKLAEVKSVEDMEKFLKQKLNKKKDNEEKPVEKPKAVDIFEDDDEDVPPFDLDDEADEILATPEEDDDLLKDILNAVKDN